MGLSQQWAAFRDVSQSDVSSQCASQRSTFHSIGICTDSDSSAAARRGVLSSQSAKGNSHPSAQEPRVHLAKAASEVHVKYENECLLRVPLLSLLSHCFRRCANNTFRPSLLLPAKKWKAALTSLVLKEQVLQVYRASVRRACLP